MVLLGNMVPLVPPETMVTLEHPVRMEKLVLLVPLALKAQLVIVVLMAPLAQRERRVLMEQRVPLVPTEKLDPLGPQALKGTQAQMEQLDPLVTTAQLEKMAQMVPPALKETMVPLVKLDPKATMEPQVPRGLKVRTDILGFLDTLGLMVTKVPQVS